VLGSTLGQDTGYLEVYHGFSQYVQANARDTAALRPRPIPPKIFPPDYSPIILTFDAIECQILATSLNKSREEFTATFLQ
jgi:hypothetical protein